MSAPPWISDLTRRSTGRHRLALATQINFIFGMSYFLMHLIIANVGDYEAEQLLICLRLVWQSNENFRVLRITTPRRG